MTTYEEWRVTGTFRNAITGREESYNGFFRGLNLSDPEGEARQHMIDVRAAEYWTDGPHLHKCTVTVTDWTEVDT